MKLEAKPHSKCFKKPSPHLTWLLPLEKGGWEGFEIVQYPLPDKSSKAIPQTLNRISTINAQQRKRAVARCTLLSLALLVFMRATEAQPLPLVPPSESYKPDPIATTSQALQGKLFFNDSERAKADKDRKDIASGKVVIEDNKTERTPILSGFIKRSDGVATYWVNSANADDTRFVTGTGKPGAKEIVATSTMVGGEPKFVLTGTVVGEKGADAKVEKKMPEKAKSKKRKKSTTEKKKNSRTDAKRASK